jgi:hypothetical protein
MNNRFQFCDILGRNIRQVVTLGVAPTLLDGVKLRGVTREPFKCEPSRPMFCKPSRGRAMSIETIPDDDDSTTQLTMQLAKKRDDLLGLDAFRRELKEQRNALARGRQCQGADCRDSAMVFGRDQMHRRLPTRSPSAVSKGLQQEARFVDKHDASLIKPPFLCGAILAPAIARLPASLVPELDVVASDRTNPTCEAIARHGCRRTPRRISGGLLPQREGTSINRWENPPSVLHALESTALSLVGGVLEARAFPGAAWPRGHRARSLPSPCANVKHFCMKHLQALQLPRKTCLPITVYPQSVASLPIPLKYLLFSYRNCSAGSRSDN